MSSKKSPDDLSGKLVQLRGLADRLGQTTDRLNEALMRAETSLAKLKLGVDVCIQLYSEVDEDGEAGEEHYLAFRRRGTDWRLLHEWAPYGIDRPEACSDTPIISASRRTRLLAASKLPELFDAFMSRVEEELKDVEGGIAQIESVITAIEAMEVPR